MKSLYDEYKHLLSLPYRDGSSDCYGLVRWYYKDVYDIHLPNYARSADFFADGIDLISGFLAEEGFEVIDTPPTRLQKGDGLLLVVPHRFNKDRRVNHVGVYVGNGMFLHHLFDKPSREDAIIDGWAQRISAVLRHPEVSVKNDENAERVNIISVLPDHVKRRIGIPTE